MPGNKKVLSQISKNMEQYIHKWLLFSAGAVTAYMSDIHSRFYFRVHGQFSDR